MPNRREIEEIDKIVDQNLEDKLQAEQLKRKLHSAFDGDKPTKSKKDDADENDDLWDNMPV